jgi:hypothetical protein
MDDQIFFPFNTCEKPNKEGIAQPYSVMCNIISCLIVLFFLLQTRHLYTFLFLLSILCFQSFHAFSHAVHIEGPFQTNVIHGLAYIINITLGYMLYSYTHLVPHIYFIIYLFLLVCFDLYTFMRLWIIPSFISQVIMLVSLFLYYFSALSVSLQNDIYWMIFLATLITMFIINEKYNYEKMLAFNPDFPYRIFIEIAGIAFFYVISSSVYKL